MDIGGGRHYMNKMFGAALDQARQADEDRAKRGGSVARISIEPREDGRGHRVIVERHTVVMHGDGDRDQSEHNFDSPQDALQFLHDILHGGEPGEGNEREEPADTPRRPRRGPGSDLESVLGGGGGESESRGRGDWHA